MGYQSKTYSLSDEVVESIEAAKAGGLTPNQYLRRLMGIESANDDPPSAPTTRKALENWRANRKPIPKHKDRPKG